ncbi:MAG: M3 family metallopeptidase [Propioniciclava sp.]
MALDPSNPLAERSVLPYQLPDFARLTPEHFREAFEAGMAEQREALARLAADPAPATAATVLEAWEQSHELLDRAEGAFRAVRLSWSTPEIDAVQADLAPLLAAHADAIYLDHALYERVVALASRVADGLVTLDAQEWWFLEKLMRAFRRAGVTLSPTDQARLRAINAGLAELTTTFARVNRKARLAAAVVVTNPAELEGLSPAEIAALACEDGTWRMEIVSPTQQPVLSRLANRGLRERVHRAAVTRGLGGPYDTRQLIVDIARARAERACLLGYRNHAAYMAETACAKTTRAINGLMGPLGKAAHAQAHADAVALSARLEQLDPSATFAAWDWEYVAGIVRKETYAVDLADVEPFLDLERVLQATHEAAHELYGISLTRREDLVGHTPEAQVFEVHDTDGTPIGLYSLDLWARDTKDGGTWTSWIVNANKLLRQLPVVASDCNFSPTTTTLTWEEVLTLFHEFGHALHALFANSRYPSTAGTEVPRDFMEFPSQVNEHWAWEAGRVLPEEWLRRLRRARKFNQGFETLARLQATLLDQAWHQTPLDGLPTSGDEVEEFEARALAEAEVSSGLVPPRYRSTYFQHIWGGGFGAGYYGYLWSEVMDADAVAWFDESEADKLAQGARFRKRLLAPGGSVDPMETYRSFRGRDPELGPLLERLGLEV